MVRYDKSLQHWFITSVSIALWIDFVARLLWVVTVIEGVRDVWTFISFCIYSINYSINKIILYVIWDDNFCLPYWHLLRIRWHFIHQLSVDFLRLQVSTKHRGVWTPQQLYKLITLNLSTTVPRSGLFAK